MFAISKIDYRFYKKVYKLGYALAILLLVAVLLIGKTVNGAKRWIVITGALSFQPSEIVKLLMIVLYAAVLTRDRDELPKFWKGIVKHALYLIPIAALLLLQPHLSATIVIAGDHISMQIDAYPETAKRRVYNLFINSTEKEAKGLWQNVKRAFNAQLKTRDEILIESLAENGISTTKAKDGKIVAKSFKEMLKDLDTLPENIKKITKKRLGTLNKAQLAGYAFSGLVLGLGIPNLNIYITNKLDQKSKEKAAAEALLAKN